MSWAWYPLNFVDGEPKILAHADVSPRVEGAMVRGYYTGAFVALDEVEGLDSRDGTWELEDFDDPEQGKLVRELLALADDPNHPNWKGLERFRDQAFPASVIVARDAARAAAEGTQ